MTDSPNADRRLCIDFGGSQIKIALMSGPRVLAADGLSVTGAARDLDDVSCLARALLAQSAAISVPAGAAPPTIAFALPGVVDTTTHRLVGVHDKYEYARQLDWARWSERHLGSPASIVNDSRAALIGELLFGCAQRETDAVLIVLGTGIGTAVIMDGVLLDGADGHRGILGGHISLTEEDIPCNCGNIGCAEVLGGSWNLSNLARRSPGWQSSTIAGDASRNSLDMAGLFAARRADDRLAITISDRVLAAWQAVAVNMCHAYAPRVVIFSGGSVWAAADHREQVSADVRRHLWSSLPRPEVRWAHDPSRSVLMGLSALAGGEWLEHTPGRAAKVWVGRS